MPFEKNNKLFNKKKTTNKFIHSKKSQWITSKQNYLQKLWNFKTGSKN